jgi:hypothetical protein
MESFYAAKAQTIMQQSTLAEAVAVAAAIGESAPQFSFSIPHPLIGKRSRQPTADMLA